MNRFELLPSPKKLGSSVCLLIEDDHAPSNPFNSADFFAVDILSIMSNLFNLSKRDIDWSLRWMSYSSYPLL